MKCQVTSSITRRVMISREVEVARYKDVCGGEKRRVNIGFFNVRNFLKVENNKLQEFPRDPSLMWEISDAYLLEILKIFFSIHNIEPNWLNCDRHYGHYDEDLGGWTGCMGKV